ncbi:hypothetical protein WG922_18450 [Ramlibacter sp. AN1015]|uniref:hypothetical protein n=1 Tax=Ramlibacter sp. AN1015 TaxID=3133428 RepID=UPI0030BC5CDC
MIPYQVDPSLHAAPPAPDRLDDGCGPPAALSEEASHRSPPVSGDAAADDGLAHRNGHGTSAF